MCGGRRDCHPYGLQHNLEGHSLLCPCLLDSKNAAFCAWSLPAHPLPAPFLHSCTLAGLGPTHPSCKAPSSRTAFLASSLRVTLSVTYSQVFNSGMLWLSYGPSYDPVLPACWLRPHGQGRSPGIPVKRQPYIAQVLLTPHPHQQPSFCQLARETAGTVGALVLRDLLPTIVVSFINGL